MKWVELIKKNQLSIFLLLVVIVAMHLIRITSDSEIAHMVLISPFWDTVVTVSTFLFVLVILRMMHQQLNQWLPFERYLYPRLMVQIGFSFAFILSMRHAMLYIAETYLYFVIPENFSLFALVIDVLFIGLINSIFIGDFFLYEWKKGLLEREELKKENIRSQYEALKNQINPHFLFNNFTTLNELIYINKDKASDYLAELSAVYRYILQNNEVNMVTISKEMEFLESYLHLLQIRFEDNLIVKKKIDPKLLNTVMPPLTLQILIENAIKHNVISKERPLIIRLETKNGVLVVRNNIQLKQNRAISSRLGLKNIQRRYTLLNNSKVDISAGPEYFTILLPVIKKHADTDR